LHFSIKFIHSLFLVWRFVYGCRCKYKQHQNIFQADVETSSIILNLTNNSVASVSRSGSPLRHYRVLRLLI
jgi:hypothetical protein